MIEIFWDVMYRWVRVSRRFERKSGNTNPPTECHVPEDLDPQHSCGNMKSPVLQFLLSVAKL